MCYSVVTEAHNITGVHEMLTSTFNTKDQNWQDGTTTYWFTLDGHDTGTGLSFDAERIDSSVFGIVDRAGHKTVVECDGMPVPNDNISDIVLRECKITDEMIQA